jgi:SAM-dependent methyltransferase
MLGLARRYLDYVLAGEAQRRLAAQVTIHPVNPAALYMDIGCHAGYNTARLAERIGTRRILGVDYNERMLAGARERGLAAVRCDVNRPLPFCTGSVDVITALDVIEHLVETNLFVRELYRVLRPGGYLLLDTPNLASWHNVLALLLGIQPFSGPNITTMLDADLAVVRAMHRRDHQRPEEGELADEDERELRRHIVVLAFRSALRLLRREGFVVERALGFGYIPFPPFLARLLCRIDPAHAHHMLIKARKPEGRNAAV